MAIDEVEVRRVAGLARLHLEPGEVRRLAAELGDILDHVDALREAGSSEETAEDATTGYPVGPSPRPASLRPDPLDRTPGVWAPDWREGFFVLPRLPAMDGGDPGTGGS